MFQLYSIGLSSGDRVGKGTITTRRGAPSRPGVSHKNSASMSADPSEYSTALGEGEERVPAQNETDAAADFGGAAEEAGYCGRGGKGETGGGGCGREVKDGGDEEEEVIF